MRKITFHAHNHIRGRHGERQQGTGKPAVTEELLDTAIVRLNSYLSNLEKECEKPGRDLDALARDLSEQLHRVEHICAALEQQLHDKASIREKQEAFRRRTDYYFAQSFLMNRARTWPRGYPGDYEIIDAAYDDVVVSQGIGQLLDRYFLSSTLARGIQNRRRKMRDMLAEELRGRHAAEVLNVGCGPCREVLELAPVIKASQAHFTNVDFDAEALRFSKQRLTKAGLGDHVSFRQYNAIRMVNAQKNIREFGHMDVIYIIGLLDYISDEILVRLIKSLFLTLKPAGVLIAVFKDSDRYTTQDYHWLVNWSGFLQRNTTASRVLFQRAGIPDDAIAISRTSDGVMIFYRVLQTVDTASIMPDSSSDQRRKHAGHDTAHTRRRQRNKALEMSRRTSRRMR